jgi:hypothetical protein
MGDLMARTKAAEAPEKRQPAAAFEIPAGLRETELGLRENRTINAWALDRVLAYLGAHSVDIVDAVAVSNTGKYCELVREGDNLALYERL